jgi:hypothetical protein
MMVGSCSSSPITLRVPALGQTTTRPHIYANATTKPGNKTGGWFPRHLTNTDGTDAEFGHIWERTLPLAADTRFFLVNIVSRARKPVKISTL